MTRSVKINVALRYYQYICKKLNKARSVMNESDTCRLKSIKMALKFIDTPKYKDMAKYNMTTIIELPSHFNN